MAHINHNNDKPDQVLDQDNKVFDTENIDDPTLARSEQVQAAIAAGDAETKLPLSKLIKIYYPAALWSMALSSALIMDGMDTGLVNNFFAQPAYVDRFGVAGSNGVKLIPADWQAAINNGQQIGAVAGLLFVGWATDRFGSRKVYMGGMVLLTAAIFMLVFAQNLPMLMMGNMLCGFPWGIYQTLTTAYAAEICPTAMRGYLTTWVSMCWGMGNFLAAGILRGSLQLEGQWSWRMPYIIQWAWPLPLFIVGYLAPESPWHLVRKGRYEEAHRTIKRLARRGYLTDAQIDDQVELIKYTDAKEKMELASANYFDCFRGVNLRRTEIACVVFAIQPLTGQGITGYATTYLTQAGMSSVMAFNYSMAIQSVNIVATGTAIYLTGYVGRRTFYLCGTAAIALFQMVLGILGVAGGSDVALGVAIMMIMIQLAFKLSVGPICYGIIAEIPNSRLRNKTIALARTSYIVTNIVIGQLLPRMLSPTAFNWGPKSGWFWFGLGALCTAYTYFRIPETKDRTYLEIDRMFEERVPARKFKATRYDMVEMTGGEHSAGREAEKTEINQLEIAPK